uniref:Zinc transporter ZIP12-like n=1 Tax=Phallusia mammillata TaxID=59560 RepID=A0A6F9DTG6_9ASCI|nr:zinc transporter ZIP12-like [Phallusia mammillata]
MQCFVSLGIGTLTADALLHLIPYALGVGEGATDGNQDENAYLWKLCATLGGIWVMFLFEKCMKMAGGGHSHSHGHVHPEHNTFQLEESTVTSFATKDEKSQKQEDEANGNSVREESQENKEESADVNKEKESKDILYCGFPIVGWMIFVGDALHNFGDGLALGVAFSESWVTGVGTSIAIFCHELPHEFSDFALYLNCGISKAKSLLLNFAAACCCYIGLYIGLGISDDEQIREWLLSVIAGIFLYIAFVDVFPEMWNEDKKRPYLTFFVQNLGLVAGWVLLLLIAIYEEPLENSIG